jgi:hypothetical protein
MLRFTPRSQAMRCMSPIQRRTVCAVVVTTALAVAAPAGPASASAPAVPASATLAAIASLVGLPSAAVDPFPIGGPLTTVARGPTVIGDTFNGGTTVCVSTAGAACSTNGS